MKRLFACTVSAMICLVACSDTASEGGRKSADAVGVLRQELRIDGHEHELLPIRGIAVSHDGTIAIFPREYATFRFFAADGNAIGSFGREGDGPGEFRILDNFGWRSDTLWIYDDKHRRVTFVTPALNTGRTIVNLPSRVFAIAPDGTLLTQRMMHEWPQTILRMRTADSPEAAVLELPEVDAERVYVRTPAGGLVLPLTNLPVSGFAVDGSRVAGAMAALDGADAGTFSLTVVTHTGDTIFARRYPFEQEAITDAAADSFMNAFAGWAEMSDAPPPARTWARIVRSSTRIPPVWPPLVDLTVGNDGSVWVELRERPGSRRYFVVDADGEPVGTVLVPKNSRPGAATKDRVWLIEKDEFDVESIVRYSINWTASGA